MSVPRAIGKSNAGPAFFTSAGARFISDCFFGCLKPLLMIALLTTFLNGRVRQADDDGFVESAPPDIDLNLANYSLNAFECDAV